MIKRMRRLTAYQRASIYLTIYPSIYRVCNAHWHCGLLFPKQSINVSAHGCIRIGMVWVRRLPFVCLSALCMHTLFFYTIHMTFKVCLRSRNVLKSENHNNYNNINSGRQRIKMNYTMKRIGLPQLRVASFTKQFFMVCNVHTLFHFNITLPPPLHAFKPFLWLIRLGLSFLLNLNTTNSSSRASNRLCWSVPFS